MNKPIQVFWYCEKWQAGGIQTIQVRLLDHMPLDQIHFDIAVSENDTDIFDDLLQREGVKKMVTLKRQYHGPGRRTLANFFSMQRYIRSGRYDVVHFNVCHGVELIYLFWAWLYRVPVRIVHCRNNDIGSGGRSRKLKIICHEICKRVFGGCANVRLANSELAKEWLFGGTHVSQGDVRILKNGIDAESYRFDEHARNQLRKELGIENAFVIGHIGHFSYQKNHEFLIEVFAKLMTYRPEAKLMLIGEGEEDAVRRQVELLGLNDHVLFLGAKKDIPPYMWAMDAFVLPSRFEGFGNVLIEAQAAGLCCFASRDVIPDMVRITENLTWIALDEGPECWAKKIAEVAIDYTHEDHTGDVIRNGYDISCMAGELIKIYKGSIG